MNDKLDIFLANFSSKSIIYNNNNQKIQNILKIKKKRTWEPNKS